MNENQSNQQSNTYEQKREQKLQEQEMLQKKKISRKLTKKILTLILIVGPISGLIIWYGTTRPETPESSIISKNGLHWHPELSIEIKGQKQKITANIGIGIRHESMHTHDSSGVIHLEMQGLVRKNDTTLGRFFDIWGKQFNSNCIFEFCNGSDGKVKMNVNGQENAEFENYQMKDNDKIEIRYE